MYVIINLKTNNIGWRSNIIILFDFIPQKSHNITFENRTRRDFRRS